MLACDKVMLSDLARATQSLHLVSKVPVSAWGAGNTCPTSANASQFEPKKSVLKVRKFSEHRVAASLNHGVMGMEVASVGENKNNGKQQVFGPLHNDHAPHRQPIPASQGCRAQAGLHQA